MHIILLMGTFFFILLKLLGVPIVVTSCSNILLLLLLDVRVFTHNNILSTQQHIKQVAFHCESLNKIWHFRGINAFL